MIILMISHLLVLSVIITKLLHTQCDDGNLISPQNSYKEKPLFNSIKNLNKCARVRKCGLIQGVI